MFPAGCHRRAAAIFACQVNDREALGSPDDSRGQHPAPRTNHPYCCIGSSCHTLAPNPFRRLGAPNGSLHPRNIRHCPSFTPRVGKYVVSGGQISVFSGKFEKHARFHPGPARQPPYICGYDARGADISVALESVSFPAFEHAIRHSCPVRVRNRRDCRKFRATRPRARGNISKNRLKTRIQSRVTVVCGLL